MNGQLYIQSSPVALSLAVDHVVLGGASPQPTPLQLAEIDGNLRNSAALGIAGYNYRGDNFTIDKDTYKGFRAAAYVSSDGSQVVIALRDTDTNINDLATYKNLAADTSFINGVPDADLATSAQEAAKFEAVIRAEYPNANITLTGHSLGGALATLLSERTGLSATVFDAPGASKLYSNLSTELAAASVGSGSSITDYRTSGDQISLVGTQFANTNMVSVGVSNVPSEADATTTLIANLGAILKDHSIDLMISQLQSGDVQMPGVVGPNLVSANIVDPLSMSEDFYRFSFIVSAITTYGLDPSSGSRFVLSGDATSPYLSSLTLPSLTGIVGYDTRFETGDVWSRFTVLAPGSVTTFGEDVDGVEFDPLGLNGKPIVIPSAFLFGLSFASAGQYNATLEEIDTLAIPEPQNWALILAGFSALGWRLRTRKHSTRLGASLSR